MNSTYFLKLTRLGLFVLRIFENCFHSHALCIVSVLSPLSRTQIDAFIPSSYLPLLYPTPAKKKTQNVGIVRHTLIKIRKMLLFDAWGRSGG